MAPHFSDDRENLEAIIACLPVVEASVDELGGVFRKGEDIPGKEERILVGLSLGIVDIDAILGDPPDFVEGIGILETEGTLAIFGGTGVGDQLGDLAVIGEGVIGIFEQKIFRSGTIGKPTGE